MPDSSPTPSLADEGRGFDKIAAKWRMLISPYPEDDDPEMSICFVPHAEMRALLSAQAKLESARERDRQWQVLCNELLAIVKQQGGDMLLTLNEAAKRAQAALAATSEIDGGNDG